MLRVCAPPPFRSQEGLLGLRLGLGVFGCVFFRHWTVSERGVHECVRNGMNDLDTTRIRGKTKRDGNEKNDSTCRVALIIVNLKAK